jgi:hypothetical protein
VSRRPARRWRAIAALAGLATLAAAVAPAAAPDSLVLRPRAAVEGEVRLSKAVTGKVGRPVAVRLRRAPEGLESYTFQSEGRWLQGSFATHDPDGLRVALVDLDFDGLADLWVSGVEDLGMRSRRSDVWRFDPRTRTYVFDLALSSLENLEVDPVARQIESGVRDCGCGGRCFYHDTFVWSAGALRRVARREQNCLPAGTVYREFAQQGDTLRLVREVPGEPDSAESRRRQEGSLRFLEVRGEERPKRWR